MLHRLFAAFLFAIGLGISGCGGGGGGDSPAPAGPSGGGGPPAPPAIPPVPTGTPVVFLSVATDTTSVVQGITIQSDTQAILRYVPSTNAVVQTDQNSSFSFAQSTLLPFSQGDKLFSVNHANSGRFDLYPIDLQTNTRSKDIFVGSTYPDSCVAVVGDDLIFRDGTNWKKLAGISTATATTLPTVIGSASPPNNCNFNLGTANGRLFDVEFSDGTGVTPDTFIIRERSIATGAFIAPNPLGSFQESPNSSDFTSYLFGFDGNFMYMARRVVSTGRIEIYRWDYTTPATLPQLRVSIIPAKPINGPLRMDVRNGFIAMLVDTAPPPFLEQRLITYNDTTGAAPVDKVLGRGFYAVQVLFLP